MDGSQFMSGINTQNTQIQLTLNFLSGTTAGGANNYNYTVDVFAGYDFTIVQQDGMLRAIQ